MIQREICIENMNLTYHVAIGQFNFNYEDYLIANNLNDDKTAVNHVFSEIESLQEKFRGSTIQFIKSRYLINQDHLFIACYHVQKAFFNKTNISNTKNLELLLYLSTNRQIKNGIKAFGIENRELRSNRLMYCIISPDNNLLEIKNNILKKFNAIEIEFELFNQNIDKCNSIMDFFQISEDQVNVITNSYEEFNDKNKENLKFLSNVLYELVCEKMVILSLEKIKQD